MSLTAADQEPVMVNWWSIDTIKGGINSKKIGVTRRRK